VTELLVKMPKKQYGAVPYRVRNGRLEVALVTSRERGRWIVPKGWPKKGGPRATARAETYEESGLRGKLHRKPLGSFKYRKKLPGGRRVLLQLKVFPLEVAKQVKDFPERTERRTQWFPLTEAEKRCSDPGLRRLITKLRRV
jgi:8-oxo-dGTP pyrophosphatase MutT (NUDIX family)